MKFFRPYIGYNKHKDTNLNSKIRGFIELNADLFKHKLVWGYKNVEIYFIAVLDR